MTDADRWAEDDRLQTEIDRLLAAKGLGPRTHVQATGLGPVNDLTGYITGQAADVADDGRGEVAADLSALSVEVEDDTPPPDEGLEPA